MSHNPKLNVYILTLKSKKDDYETFRDLIKLKYGCSNDEDKSIFKSFFSNFLDVIGKDNFRKDSKAKKVIGTSKKERIYNDNNVVDDDEKKYSLNLHSTKHIIEGIIDGGKYGILREYADINNKDNKAKLDVDQAVLDKFYILLHTPLNSKYGYLLIQSYTEETIQEPIKNLLRNLFCHENYFGNPIIEPFVPKKFVDKFREESKVRLFTYTKKIGLSEVMRNQKVIVRGQAFDLRIEISPCDNEFKPESEELHQIIKEFDEEKIRETKLKDCNKKIFIEDSKKRRANFDIEKELSNIRPTIYLEDEGVKIDDSTGMPDFEKVKEYCLNLLEEIKKEFNERTDIDEI